MKVADDFDKKMEGVGTAYVVLESDNFEPIKLKIGEGAYDAGYSMSLIPETIFHFEADGITERNNFVNLKKNIITFDCGTAMEKVVMLHRVQKLPCLRIRPSNQQEILEVKMSSSGMNVSLMNKAMIYDAAANAVSFAGFHMNKLTWKDAVSYTHLTLPTNREV